MSTSLDDLAERMSVPAALLVLAVQNYDVDKAHQILTRLDVMEHRALAVRLAAWTPAPATEVLRRVTEVRMLCKSGEAARIRHRAHASRGELAAAAGVSESVITSWETGEFVPRGENAVRFGAALDALRAGLGEIP